MNATSEKLISAKVPTKGFPLLETGYHLSAEEFHWRYEQMPEHCRAELIEGIVYMASPLHIGHGDRHALLTTLCGLYALKTPGVTASVATTVRLDNENEYQPDGHMRIDVSKGGRTQALNDKFVAGGPEFVFEISNTTLEMDLHEKFKVYERNGVLEYLVWQVNEEKIELFQLKNGRFYAAKPDAKKILRSKVMPGFWLDTAALLKGKDASVLATLEAGLRDPSHLEFVKHLSGSAK